TYSTSSRVGFVSSKRRWQMPVFSSAMPKFKQIDFACPMCKYPLGSGGKRVATRPPHFSFFKSSSTIRRTKSSPVGSVSRSLMVLILSHHPHRFTRPIGNNHRNLELNHSPQIRLL